MFPFLALFAHFHANKNSSKKSGSVTFFYFFNVYCCEEFQKKTLNRFRQKKLVADTKTEKLMDAQTSMSS